MQHPASPYPRKRALVIFIVTVLALGLAFFAYQSAESQENEITDIDAGFARSMMLHHTQAIQMSMMMRDAASPEIQALAQSIVLKQTREMGVMEGWLSAWKEPVMVEGAPMAWVENANNVQHLDDQLYQARCIAEGGAMDGLATPEELEQLKTTTGTDKEVLFLKLMLAHHRAALPMAWFAKRNGESSLVKALAASMIREQGMEIGWIQMKLQQFGQS